MERIKSIYNALGNYFNIPVGSGDYVSYPFIITDFANRYGFNVVEVFHTLKILEKESFLMLSDSFDEPSQVMIKASRDDLYGFQVNNPQYSELIKCMLRSLPGVLTDFVKINEDVLAKKLGTSTEMVMEQLKKLEAYHFLSYAPRNDKPQILFLSEFVDTKHFGLSKENYYDRKRDAEVRVKAVIDYVNNDEECRSVQLLRYFNEKTKKACGNCDVCQRKRSGSVSYSSVEERLESVVSESPLPLREVVSQCNGFEETKVLDAIRFLVDNGVFQLEDGGNLKRKGNKKSRHP
jgi:ATP-dependent DNA helicase RecQ